ncbi:unnamed protein product [Rhizophagus irregularis]|nr:unnamed protein product [Rhizophagus irregularis]
MPESKDKIDQIFNRIAVAEKDTMDWIVFYRQKWVISSLNKCISNIDDTTWLTSPNNTNTAEAAHALVNRREKNLKIVTVILLGQRLDKEKFSIIKIHKSYNIPNRGRDKGPITRNVQSNKRKANAQVKN